MAPHQNLINENNIFSMILKGAVIHYLHLPYAFLFCQPMNTPAFQWFSQGYSENWDMGQQWQSLSSSCPKILDSGMSFSLL